MHSKVKNYALVFCLFVFLFVMIGGGLHMNPGGALLAAATGTPLMIYAFNRKSNGDCRPEHVPSQLAGNEVRDGSDNRIIPIDESEVAVNESAGSERSEPTRAVRRHLPDERAGTYPSLLHRRAGGISHGRSLRRRVARRDLHHHGEAGLDHLRADGCLRNGGLACPAARRAIARALRKTQPHALRAQRLVRKSKDRLRQVAYGLHRAVARTPVPDR